jgi:hypothetical protein
VSVAVARRHQIAQETVARRTARQVAATWAEFDPFDLDGSWRAYSDRLYATVSAGQFAAASQADPYLDRLATSQQTVREPAGRVNARRLAGIASDGRPLEGLLFEPVVMVKAYSSRGVAPADAMRYGLNRLTMHTSTQVIDAGRGGVSVATAATPSVKTYTRVTDSNPCARCAVLAGRVYRWNDGFLRHPMCMCTHMVDLTGVAPERLDASAYFDSLDPAEQARVFTKAGAEAIRDGANINQVVNARRGMQTTTAYGRKVTVTTAGRSARGVRGPRLMPEQIYADARNREDAIRLLTRFGYLA